MTIRDLIPWRKRRGQREDDEERLPAEHEVRDLFRDAVEDFFSAWSDSPRLSDRPVAPAIDVSETPDEYRVSVELPGMSRDDIEVTVDQGRLRIRGEKKEEQREEDEDYLRVERSYGTFSRTIPLPSTVEEEDIAASFQDGVLKVDLPKSEQERGRRIEIKGETE